MEISENHARVMTVSKRDFANRGERAMCLASYRGAVLLLLAAAILTGCAQPSGKSAWFGLNTQLGHFDLEGRWPAAKTTERDRQIYFDLVSELGVTQIRDLFMSWARAQPAPDAKYDFAISDDLVRRAQAAHTEILAVCWAVPRWAAATSTGPSIDFGVPARAHADAFKAFVRKFVDRYDGDGLNDMSGLRRPIEAYEFMNEMENVPPGEYAWWLKLFYETVKAEDSRAMVSIGSLRSPGIRTVSQPEGDYPTYLERLLAEPSLSGPKYPYFDVVSFHNYPSSYPGRSEFSDALAYIRKTMAARQLNLPVWLTEYGFNSGTQEEDRQKDNIVKWAIKARALGIDRVYLYCLRDYHWPGGAGAGENLGLVREAAGGEVPTKKPAFRAVATLLRELSERPRVARRGEGLYVLTGKGEPIYILWKEESYDPSSELIPGWWRVRTLNDQTITRQGSAIAVTGTPVFLQNVKSPFMN